MVGTPSAMTVQPLQQPLRSGPVMPGASKVHVLRPPFPYHAYGPYFVAHHDGFVAC